VAEEDLLDILSYIGSDNPAAADALQQTIERSLQLLCRHPHMGRIPEEEELVRMGYRYVVIEDYLAFYTIEGDEIIVHRIVHGARDYLSFL
jgi:plasmid stabilization system protein ParE